MSNPEYVIPGGAYAFQCYLCGTKISMKEYLSYSPAEKDEVRNSAMCQSCQEDVLGEGCGCDS